MAGRSLLEHGAARAQRYLFPPALLMTETAVNGGAMDLDEEEGSEGQINEEQPQGKRHRKILKRNSLSMS